MANVTAHSAGGLDTDAGLSGSPQHPARPAREGGLVRRPEKAALLKLLGRVGIVAAVLVAILVVWELIVALFSMPVAILPSPIEVAKTGWDSRGYLWTNAVPTILESVVGYTFAVVIAVPVGLLLSRPGRIATALNTGVLSMQIFPKVAIAPLLIIWFGFGYFPKFLFVFLLGFFPVAISSSSGFASVPSALRDLGRVLGLGRWDLIRKLYGPHALPQIFTGMKISAAFAMTAAIVYEFVGANSGLGYVITAAQANIRTPLMFAALLAVTVLGFMIYGAVVAIEAVSIPWHISRRH